MNSTDQTADGSGIARSEAIAQQSRSRLMQVASRLDRRRYRLFCPCYASMRIIDDLVDRDLPEGRAGLTEEAARHRLEDWLAECIVAVTGEGRGTRHPVLQELAAIAPGTGMPVRPWQRLAGALRLDIAGQAPESWEDFYHYSAGASGGPTEAFLAILALGEGQAALRADALACAAEAALPLAHFCYLVHIARDLTEDAAGDPRLLSVPDAVLRGVGLTKAALRVAAERREADAFLPVLRAVLEEAETHGPGVAEACAAMLPYLDDLGRDGLQRIVAAYRDLHGRIAAAPEIWIRDRLAGGAA